MHIEEFLRSKNTSFDQLSAHVMDNLPNVAELGTVFIAGSTIEGLGNSFSDIDVYFVSEDKAICSTKIPSLSGILFDVHFWTESQVSSAQDKLRLWNTDNLPASDVYNVDHFEREFLHRLENSISICNDQRYSEILGRSPIGTLAKYKAALTLRDLKSNQVDLVGMRLERNWHTMNLVVHDTVKLVIDLILSAHGITNFSDKWRLDLLKSLQSSESLIPIEFTETIDILQFFYELLQLPKFATESYSVAYASKCISIAWKIVPWALQKLYDPDRLVDFPKWSLNSTQPGSDTLPALDFDIVFVNNDAKYEMRKLMGKPESILISPEIYTILAQFDGETDKREVGIFLDEKEALVDQLLQFCEVSNYLRPPLIGEEKLKKILLG